MKDLFRQYELAKQHAQSLMQQGKLSEYFNTLLQVNEYEKLMLVTISN